MDAQTNGCASNVVAHLVPGFVGEEVQAVHGSSVSANRLFEEPSLMRHPCVALPPSIELHYD